MALNNLGLGFVFSAHNLASGTIGRLRGELTSLGVASRVSGGMMRGGFALAAAGVAPLIAGVGGLATALSLANAASEFQQGVRRVANISGATTEELRQLRDAAIEAGIQTQFSPDEAIQGLSNLAAQGFNASDSMRLLNTSLNLAAGGQISIDDATMATASAIRVFSLEAEEQLTVADKLLAITNKTALQANDLTLALGTVSRGAGLTNQSLDEMLISMGLVRNAGLDVSVAASSVSSGLQFAARNASEFAAVGVQITDEAGHFRDFGDIIIETSRALGSRYTNDAERAAAATELFGRFGVTAYQNISNQLEAMVGTGEGQFASMEEALASLRGSMRESEGTAQEFADNLLDTFEGQKVLLRGTMQTIAVVLGEPFALVFKPIVKGITETLNFFLRIVNNMPDQMKVAAAGVFVAVAAFLTLGGALSIVVGLFVVVLPFLLTFVKVMAILLIAMLPVVATVLAFGAAIGLVVALARRNFGGLGDFFERTIHRIGLLWDGVRQLISEGSLSGAVRDELTKDPGLRTFVIRIGMIVHRVRQFWNGFQEAFTSSMARLQPVFATLRVAFERLGEALGFVASEGAGAVSSLPSEQFARVGARVATFVADVIEVFAKAITFIVDVVRGVISGVRQAFDFFAPVFKSLSENFTELGASISDLFREMGIQFGDSGNEAVSWGQLIGNVIGGIVGVVAFMTDAIVVGVRFMVDAARLLIRAWNAVRDVFFAMSQGIILTWNNIADALRNSVDRIIISISTLASAIPSGLRPDFLEGFVAAGDSARSRITERERASGLRQLHAARTIQGASTTAAFESDARSRDVADRSLVDQAVKAVEATRRSARTQQLQEIRLVVDGETLARVIADKQKQEGERGFVPVPNDV